MKKIKCLVKPKVGGIINKKMKMRTQEQLNSKEFQDDMTELKELLDKAGIKYTFGKHEGASPKVKELIGYYPTGEWHLMVGKNSIIRGMVSFGAYEIMGEKDDDPIRFTTAQEMFEEIKRRINCDVNSF